ncbi:PAS domain S-box-containing protein [Palleronia aestuarii]|uniref:PAS domain S-box-containing protein n=1 Tax=Palleronia aestuarii TaxID=568105 RepID=A0A2W7MPQ4_9RHOB|nr:PAS domain-containing protein [Palleronia aestuarii]PZX09828.1 PAS domain S-box-containing protein [Palleronia aestuarii]
MDGVREVQTVTAAEATRNFGRVQEMVIRSPVIVTHHGRAKLAILGVEEFERLGDAPKPEVDPSQRRKLLLILDSISEGYISLDSEWRYVTVNRAAELFLGQPREDLIGRVMTEAVPRIRGTLAEAQLRRAMYHGEDVSFGWDSVLHEGRRLHMRAFPLPLPTGGIGILFANTGERERLEGQERLQHAALRSIMRELPGWAMYAYDANGEILDWPESAATLIGWSDGGKPGFSIERLYPDACVAAGRPWSEMAKARRDGRYEDDAVIVHQDGHELPCRSIVLAPADCAGRFIRIVKPSKHSDR